MGWLQILTGLFLVLVLLGLALGFTWKQVAVLRELRRDPYLAEEDSRYERGLAYRRLVSCGLLFLLALLLVGALVYLEEPAQRLAEEARARRDQGMERAFTPEEKLFLRVYSWYWIGFLLVLLAVVILAAFDLWAVRRYGRQQHRRIQDDRRAMIEDELGRMRQQRNGHS